MLRTVKYSWPVVFACSVIQGCTATIPVRRNEPVNNDRVYNFDQVNSRLERTTAVITCKDGSTYYAADVHIDPDSARFADENSPDRYVLATTDVMSVTIKDNFGGIVIGALAGALTGLGIGVGKFVLFRGGGSNEGMEALVFASETTALGTVCGAIMGGFYGNRHKFVFPVDSRPQIDTTTTHGR